MRAPPIDHIERENSLELTGNVQVQASERANERDSAVPSSMRRNQSGCQLLCGSRGGRCQACQHADSSTTDAATLYQSLTSAAAQRSCSNTNATTTVTANKTSLIINKPHKRRRHTNDLVQLVVAAASLSLLVLAQHDGVDAGGATHTRYKRLSAFSASRAAKEMPSGLAVNSYTGLPQPWPGWKGPINKSAWNWMRLMTPEATVMRRLHEEQTGATKTRAPVFAEAQMPRPPNGPMPTRRQPRADATADTCALILQRMFVRRVDGADVANNNIELTGPTMQSSRLVATGKEERVCITYEDVERATTRAKTRIGFMMVARDEVSSIEPSVPTIGALGELNQEITTMLAQQFDLSNDEIENGLPMIDMSRTSTWRMCPLHVRPITCDVAGRFRSYTGHCNNLEQPSWGAANTPFARFLSPRHPDGIQAERVSVVDGSPLPSPRLVSNTVHKDVDLPSSALSLLFMVGGQIIDHDVALAAPPRGKSCRCAMQMLTNAHR